MNRPTKTDIVLTAACALVEATGLFFVLRRVLRFAP